MATNYYDSSDNYGRNQYVTLETLVNNYMMSRVDSDPTATAERYQIEFFARRALQELYFDVMKEIRAVELTVTPRMNLVVPEDFVSLVRLSVVMDNGHLLPIAEDRNMTIADVYLQDNAGEILLDNDGYPLVGADRENTSAQTEYPNNGEGSLYTIAQSFSPNMDYSNYFPYGRYRYDKQDGVIHIGIENADKNYVLEYISDGLVSSYKTLDQSTIRIHKFAETAVYAYVYYNLIQGANPRFMPANEKLRAHQNWFNERRLAKRRMNPIVIKDYLQAFRKANKWIK